jgi:hypothetical protein
VGGSGPMWHLDVGRLGYTPEPVPQGGAAPLLGIDRVCFLSNDTLAITFVTRVAPIALPRPDQPDESLPYRLNALFVNTKTGSIISTRDWPTASTRSRILPTTGGSFVVLTPDELSLYSPTFDLLKQLRLPLERDALKDDWDANPSPGGRYLVLNYVRKTDLKPPPAPTKDHAKPKKNLTLAEIDALVPKEDVQVAWIDLETLSIIKNWVINDSMDFPQFISDAGVAFSWTKTGNPDGPWSPFCNDFFCNVGWKRVISDNAVVSEGFVEHTGDRRWISLVNMQGKSVFRDVLGPKEILRFPVASPAADGASFAVAVLKGKGGSEFFDIGPHYALNRIAVFDVPNLRWSYTLDARKQGITGISGLALSPDGSLLGLITQDGNLEAYRIP